MTLLHQNSLRREGVDVGRFRRPKTIAAEAIRSKRIGRNDDDIRTDNGAAFLCRSIATADEGHTNRT